MNNFFRDQPRVENDGVSFDSTDPAINKNDKKLKVPRLKTTNIQEGVKVKPNDILFNPDSIMTGGRKKSTRIMSMPDIFTPKSGQTQVTKESSRPILNFIGK